ncbi:DUF2577 domain-containing protein [Paenibacillus herberti]|uniref:DUF2577 domain-containing protein n=1 Tax=Paenibacillus herberti TaxID=1619309 RepID=A0A229P037_9BACL|nr:DUF2577 domain-containing protein [Paenibacillus herberti]OXM15229.1 hypothetical protein CGZ75_00315 [Paenibacillus herberti]
MSINDAVKQIVKRSFEAQQLTKAMNGTVTSVQPLEVTIEQRFMVPEEFLAVPEHLTSQELELEGKRILLRRGLTVGDKLILLRSEGGSPYVVIGRLET